MNNRPIRLLLVDDDEAGYVLTRSLLSEVETAEYSLDWEASYDDALEVSGRNEHDVLLVDYRLGARNGVEFLGEALRGGCRAPMILLTGYGDHRIDVDAMKAGATDYLVKDRTDTAQLERAIRYAVERSRSENERALLEEQLQHAQKMEAVWRLAGGIAHDFNNLLTAIIGYAEIGRRVAGRDSSLQPPLVEIQKAAQLAAGLTSQLLSFSSRQMTERVDLNVNDLIMDTHKMLRRLIGEDVEVVTVAGPELGRIRVASGLVQQVLMNIAVNARDAMPKGGKLTLETMNVTLDEEAASRTGEVEPGEYVLLAISDTGTGMTEEVRDRIFDPFFTTKEAGRGTGLGLTTCDGIVKQNGGHIAVSSQQGRGTTFRIYLPRVGTSEEPQEEVAETRVMPKGKENVLLVEDEETLRGMVAAVLRGQGYQVMEADNGGEAIRLVEESDGEGVDLLLTDVVMPLMGGRELATRLKASKSVSKVLYTSGYTDVVAGQGGALEGEAGFLSKPFTPDSLAHKVREVLDGDIGPSSPWPRSPGA